MQRRNCVQPHNAKKKEQLTPAKGPGSLYSKKNFTDFSADDIEAKYIHTLEQQIRILELQNSFLKIELNGKRSTSSQQPNSIENRQAPVECDQCDQLRAENLDLNSQLVKIKGTNEVCKRTLNEEIIHLRKELDDCQPEIASREAELARLRIAHADSNRQLSQAFRTIHLLQTELNEKIKCHNAALCKKHKSRRDDVARLTNHLHQLQRLAADENRKHQDNLEKLNELNQRVLQLELQVKRERATAERVTEENAWLIEENAQLQLRLSKTIMDTNQEADTSVGLLASLSDIVTMGENERLLRQELLELQNQLKQEKLRCSNLQDQITDLEAAQFERTEAENNMCQQLEAAEVAGRKLGEDNKGLREQILTFEKLTEEHKTAIAAKEATIKAMKGQLEHAERQIMILQAKIDQTKQQQRDKFNQLDSISSELKNLTRSLCDSKEL